MKAKVPDTHPESQKNLTLQPVIKGFTLTSKVNIFVGFNTAAWKLVLFACKDGDDAVSA